MSDTETKIVKAKPKKDQEGDSKASKVQIKAVDIAIIEAQAKKAAKARTKAAVPAQRPAAAPVSPAAAPPAGKPVPKASVPGRPVPSGRPMPKNAVPMKKAAVPQDIAPKDAEVSAAEAEAAAAKAEAEAAAVKAAEKQAEDKALEEKPEVKAEEPKTPAAAEAEPEKKPRTRKKKTEEPEKTEPEVKEPEKAEEEKKTAAEGKTPEAPEKESEKPEKEEAKSPEKPEKKAEKAETEEPEKKEEAKPEEKSEKAEPEEAKAPEAPSEPEKKPEEAKEEKKEEKVDYTPGIGVKIIKKASDEPQPQPQPPVRRPRPDRNAKPGDRSGRAPQSGEERKPKEFVRSKPGTAQDNNPRKKKDFAPRPDGGKREKVVAYTAAPGSTDNRKRSKKDKDKNKRDRFDAAPLDLTKSEHKKHSKYKDRTEVVDQNELELEALPTGSVVITVPITLGGFCEQVEKSTSQAIMALMKMGIMANINQNLDEETAVLLGMELGVNVVVNKIEETESEEGIDLSEDRESDLKPRPPIITVMGHVDHGKTSLLDAIRKTNVTAGEAGGITQHIGASEVDINGKKIVFLDTPGHEAFTAMRARGAHVTDIAVLVVAADDSVKPQTIESISHAKAAGVPIIVAINKMDKPGANADRVKKDLADQGVLVEDWGGTVISVPVSAKTGEGITQLLEMILLQAEMLELKANPDRLAMGNVIEARLDKSRGPVATLLVTNGTLSAGSAVVAGTASGRIRVMTDWRGNPIPKVGPSRAVEITGLTEVPQAGDEFYAVRDERTAREIAERRKEKLRQEILAKSSSTTLEKLFSQIAEGETKDLNLIIKADVQGSVGALEQSLEKLHNENVRVKIIHTGVGTVNESDVMLAETSDAVIIGFNVRPSSAVQAMADEAGVEIRTYRIIYEIIDDIEAAMKGMLDPEFKEVILGKAEVRNTFKVPGVGIIAGAYITEGKVTRNASVRLLREGIVIHEGTISSLKRFKDDAREVLSGFECGIGIEKYNDIKEGDIIEAFRMEEVERS